MSLGRRGALVFDVALVAALLFGVLFVAAGPTGFLLLEFERNVSLSVQQEVAGEVTSFTVQPDVLTIGNSTDIGVELTNTGTDPIQATYTVQVFDANFSLLTTYPGPEETLQAGSLLARDIRHTPHDTGTYIIQLQADVGPNTVQTAQFLFVNPPPPPPPPPEPVTIVRRRIEYVEPAPLPDPLRVRRWNVTAPRNVTVEQGGSTIIPIRVRNTGNLTIENVQIALQHSSNLTVDFTPKILFTVAPDTTRTFALQVAADNETTGRQQIQYHVTAGSELSARSTIPIQVVPTLTQAQLLRKIAALESLLQELEAEMRLEQRQGGDVSGVNRSVQEAHDTLGTAREAVDNGDLQRGRVLIEDAHSSIRDAFQRLFKLQSERFLIAAPLAQSVLVLLLIAVIVAVLMVGAYYYLRERELARPKLLREQEER